MEWYHYLIIGLIVLTASLFIFSNYYVQKNIKKLTSDDFQANMRAAQIIDVRPKIKFNEGHVVGARNIPFAMIKNSTKALLKDKPVFLVCDNGKTSKRAATYLYSVGYTDLNVLKGGMAKWNGKIK